MQERGQTWLPVKLCVAEIRGCTGFYDLETEVIFAFIDFCDFVPSLFAFYTTFGRLPIRVSCVCSLQRCLLKAEPAKGFIHSSQRMHARSFYKVALHTFKHWILST